MVNADVPAWYCLIVRPPRRMARRGIVHSLFLRDVRAGFDRSSLAAGREQASLSMRSPLLPLCAATRAGGECRASARSTFCPAVAARRRRRRDSSGSGVIARGQTSPSSPVLWVRRIFYVQVLDDASGDRSRKRPCRDTKAPLTGPLMKVDAWSDWSEPRRLRRRARWGPRARPLAMLGRGLTRPGRPGSGEVSCKPSRARSRSVLRVGFERIRYGFRSEVCRRCWRGVRRRFFHVGSH